MANAATRPARDNLSASGWLATNLSKASISSCLSLTPTVSVRLGALGRVGAGDSALVLVWLAMNHLNNRMSFASP